MRQSLNYYVCDGNDGTCEETSPAAARWIDAKMEAERSGWSIAGDHHHCPEHKP